MKQSFDTWLLRYVDELRSFIHPEGGYTRNHPVHGPSAMVSEKNIETLAYAAVGKFKAYHNAILRLLEDKIAETSKEVSHCILQIAITRWWRFSKIRKLNQKKASIAYHRARLQDLHITIMQLTGDDLRMVYEETKLANKIS